MTGNGNRKTFVDVVFDGPPGPEPSRFVEVENENGKSIDFGEWIERPDGYGGLHILAQSHHFNSERPTGPHE